MKKSLTASHVKGFAILFVGFPVVTVSFNVDFSLEEDACFEEGSFMDEVFSVVIEQKLFNQPVEVRVRSGGLGFLLGKISGGVKAFFKCSFSRRSLCPTAL